jgi:hypothetical protein
MEKLGDAETLSLSGVAWAKTLMVAMQRSAMTTGAKSSSGAGGAKAPKACPINLGVSTGCNLAELIWALALPAGLYQAIFASKENRKGSRQRTTPSAVTQGCRTKCPFRICIILPFVENRSGRSQGVALHVIYYPQNTAGRKVSFRHLGFKVPPKD